MTDSGYSKSQVLRGLKALRKAGLIMIKTRFTPLGDFDSNVYTIPVLIGPALPPIEREGGSVMDDTTSGVVDVTTGGLPDDTLTIEGETSEGLTGERTSPSNPPNIIRNSTASESLAVSPPKKSMFQVSYQAWFAKSTSTTTRPSRWVRFWRNSTLIS
jgi:hypothetical protein